MRRLLVAGNWKMNLVRESATELARTLATEFPKPLDSVDILVCPPFPYLMAVGAEIASSAIQLGAQNGYHEAPGAFTGEVAIEMLLDVGCEWVVLGHSERRHVLGESNALLNQKVTAALRKGIHVVFCVGELQEQRETNQTEMVLDSQMQSGLDSVSADDFSQVVIAYEPVWAIGTGLTATEEQAESAHKHLRNWLANRYNSELAGQVRILYGGSVKPTNALALLGQPNIDGVLVGGASLTSEAFVPIVQAAVDAAG